jgi:natural product biosynthesis luciferase-like monooxygenase protein
MKFGLNFFPSVRPDQISAADYYNDALELAVAAEQLGFSHIKTVEHYFRAYGGYSPSPIVFLSAVAQRTQRIRLVTGAVLPAFNHPIKLAGELAMLDNLSGGRVDAGFARAFLPEEFDNFHVPLSESRARYEDCIAAVKRLWTEENVVFDGKIHHFGPITMLPRPLQKPHPPMWGTAVRTPESFDWIGRAGLNLMFIAYSSDRDAIVSNLNAYRDAYAATGSSSGGRVQLAYHCLVAESDEQARREARPFMEQYLEVYAESLTSWAGRTSDQYPGYEQLYDQVRALSFDRMLDAGRAFLGSPETVADQIREVCLRYGEIELSLQVSFGFMPKKTTLRTVRLLAERVMPRFREAAEASPAR